METGFSTWVGSSPRTGVFQPLTAGASKTIAWDINGSSAGSTTVEAEYLATCSGPVRVLESSRGKASSEDYNVSTWIGAHTHQVVN